MNKIESERRQQGTLSGDRRACLTFIKKFMDKIDSKQLSKKFDLIFDDEKSGVSCFLSFPSYLCVSSTNINGNDTNKGTTSFTFEDETW